MGRLQKRIDEMERKMNRTPKGISRQLVSLGFDPDRAEELVGPDGIDFEGMTDSELGKIAPDPNETVGSTNTKWKNLTDHQLERIASGESPNAVVGGYAT